MGGGDELDLKDAMGRLSFLACGDPRTQEAYEVISEVLVDRKELLEACRLVEPAIASLMDELGRGQATDWGLVNDCLLKIGDAVRKAEGGEK